MKYIDENINSVSDLLRLLNKRSKGNPLIWFRGHANKTWPLVPSVARTPKTLEAEATLIKRFKQNALPFTEHRPTDEWEWMFLLQHYGVPTRLLDWTEAPLVALFFACENPEHYNKDDSVWCLLPKELNTLAKIRNAHIMELPFLGVEQITETYKPSAVAQETTSSLNPIAVTALRASRRMYAQLGTFTVIHREALAIESLGTKKHVWRWIIPKAKKKYILSELSKLSINRLTLFPELTSVATVAREIL